MTPNWLLGSNVKGPNNKFVESGLKGFGVGFEC